MKEEIRNNPDMCGIGAELSMEMGNEILDSICCGVFSYTVPEKNLLAVNGEARRVIERCGIGNNVGEFLEFLREKISSGDMERIERMSEGIGSVGESLCFCFDTVSGGESISVQSTIKLLEFSEGQKYVLCTMSDITDQVNMQNSISRERDEYRHALSNGSEFTFTLDLTDGMVHENFITIHGVSAAEDFGIEFPISFDDMNNIIVNKLKIEVISNERRGFFTVSELLDRYGRGVTSASVECCCSEWDVYTRITAMMYPDDLNGHIKALIIGTDITDAKRTDRAQKAALKDANEKLLHANNEINTRIDVILNGISGGLKIIDADKDYQYVFISEGAAEIQGYTADEFMKKFRRRMTGNIYQPDVQNTFYDIIKQTEIKGSYSVKYRVEDKNGRIRYVLDRGNLITDEKGRKFYYALVQDITEIEDRNGRLQNMLLMQKQMSELLGSGILAYTVPEHEILILNQETRNIFGLYNGELDFLGGVFMNKIIPEDMEIVREIESRISDNENGEEYIFHVKRGEGDIVTVRAFTKHLSFENGQRFILSSMVDITKRELIEKSIVEERRQYRDALAYDSELSFNLDITDGYVRESLISKNDVDFIKKLGLELPVDYGSLAEHWFSGSRTVFLKGSADAVKSREKLISMYKNGNTRIDMEYYLPSDNRYFDVQILLSESSVNGHINAGFFIYDVTHERKAERRNRSIIYSIGRIYCTIFHFSFLDNTYIVVRQHEDIARNIPEKGTLEEFRSYYIGRMVEPEFTEIMSGFLDYNTFNERFKNADSDSVEYRRKNLGWCRGTIIVGERNDSGDPVSFTMTINVIEEQKKEELTRQEMLRTALKAANVANTAKTEFLANMSHDIRTPMNAIIGMTAIAETHIDDKERVSDCLSKITVSSKHLLGLINEILDMSKIESGKVDLQEEEFNLPELIDNMLVMSKPLVEEKKHDLSVSIHNIEHENVVGDSRRIQQVFINIMSNAIKYTPEGGHIRLSISEKVRNKKTVGCYEFIFEDNGIGMSEEFVGHIFEPFVRDESDNRINDIKGTGLGMAITNNIVHMMNGNIKVDSKLGKGTKITVEIVLKLQEDNKKLISEKLAGLSVLVIDNDEFVCVNACEMLKELGMNGEWVLSGEEAVEKVTAEHEAGREYFALLMDWKMPGMDGIEATREIRKIIGNETSVIIISARDFADIEPEARAAGVDKFMSKPLFKSRLLRLFNEIAGDVSDKDESNDLANLQQVDFTGKRALLVEDNDLNAEIAEEILGMTGISIERARNGREAFDMMCDSDDGYYDIVFMDIQMPIMNGYEASRAIRSLYREYTKKVPIIAMTANAFAEDVAASKNAGMNEHIAKPLDFTQLCRSLEKWLK